MSLKTNPVAHFDIAYFRYLDEQGQPEQPLPAFTQDTALLHALYRMMALTRLFDKKAIALQRTGKLGTYPSVLGQEAIGVGIGAAMRQDDIFCPYYREQGAQLWRGVTLEEIWLYWGGDERGSCFRNNPHDFPICVPIASQTLHAVGAAYAMKHRQQDKAVVTVVGDGGTSRGDFYEALNVAGAWELPVVFVINNNEWAISVPRSQQTKAQTLAQKAIAAGLPGCQVDGNDVIAVKDAVESALEKARRGEGASVIEAISYRMGDHTTADDASRYRSAEVLAQQGQRDPILRLKKYLMAQQLWDEEQENKLMETLGREVEMAVARFEALPPLPPESMFDYLYQDLPAAYQNQRAEVKGGQI